MKYAIFIAGTFLFGCTDSDNNFIRGTFGTYHFSSESTYSAYNGSLLVLTANRDSLMLRILISPVSEPDSFTMHSEDTLDGGSEVAFDSGDHRYVSYDGGGSVTIQKIDERHVRGNFSGRLVNSDIVTDTMIVTNGQFDVEIDSDDPY
ncbi:hypothetical protein K1X84_15960 [bacterium]|nr:hypothetical protein [bacterium]